MFVNKDYKKWHLFNLVHKYLEQLNASQNTILIISDSNQYLEYYVKNKNWIKITENLMPYINNVFSLVIILKPFSKEILNKINAKTVIDLYNDYMNYENQKIPINYIVDEFNEDLDYYNNYTLEKEKIAKGYIEHYNKKFYVERRLFNKVEIETINCCNNICSFCPVNALIDPRIHAYMSEKMFKNIIDQLSEIRYDGALALFSNNEPLLDKRLYDFACYAKAKLPNAYLYIFTNGKLLTTDLLKKLLIPFDHIHINNYNNDKTLTQTIKKAHEYLINNSVSTDKATIHLRNIKEILSSRGGSAPNKEKNLSLKCSCILPYSQLVIRPDGKISLCCNDALGKVTLGDIKFQSLLDVWLGQQYDNVRKQINFSRSCLKLCRECDFIFTPLFFERI